MQRKALVLSFVRRTYDWMGSTVHRPYADYILAFLFYLEAIFFVPTDPLLILFCMERPQRAWYYAALTTIASVLGGLSSYAIGFVLWRSFGSAILHIWPIYTFLSPENFAYLAHQYAAHAWVALLIAGFTPIPYKAATITAGFCSLPLTPFIICSFIARGARFFLIAACMRIAGPTVKKYIERYFTALFLIIGCLILSLFLLWRQFTH